MNFKLFLAILMALNVVLVLANPVEETAGDLKKAEKEESMEAAESQNPFMPRFAMRRFKERREQAHAQRRNNPQRRQDHQITTAKCPQNHYQVSK